MQVPHILPSSPGFVPDPIWPQDILTQQVNRLSKEILSLEKQLSPGDFWEDIQSILLKRKVPFIKHPVYLQTFVMSLDPLLKDKEKAISSVVQHALIAPSLLKNVIPTFASAQILLSCSDDLIKKVVHYTIPKDIMVAVAKHPYSQEQKDRFFSCIGNPIGNHKRKKVMDDLLTRFSSPSEELLSLPDEYESDLAVKDVEDFRKILQAMPPSNRVLFIYCFPGIVASFNDLDKKAWWKVLLQDSVEEVLKKRLYKKDFFVIEPFFMIIMLFQSGRKLFSECSAFLQPSHTFIILAELKNFLEKRKEDILPEMKDVGSFYKETLKANLHQDKLNLLSKMFCQYWESPTLKVEVAEAFSKDLFSDSMLSGAEFQQLVVLLSANSQFIPAFYNFPEEIQLKVIQAFFTMDQAKANKRIYDMVAGTIAILECKEVKEYFIQKLLKILEKMGKKESFLDSLSKGDRGIIDSYLDKDVDMTPIE